MKKSTACFWLAVVAAGGYAIWKTVQNARKEYKELKLREEVNKTLPKDESEPEVIVESQEESKIDYEINLPKRLFREVRFNLSNIDLPVDCVDLDSILSENGASEHVIHVTQSFDKSSKRNVLNFLFEIPCSALPNIKNGEVRRRYSDGNTCVGDFVHAIKGKYNHEKSEMDFRGFSERMENIVSDPENLGIPINKSRAFRDCRIEGYLYVTYEQKNEDDEWEAVSGLITLDKSIYTKNPFDSDHESMTDYVYDIKKYYAKEGVENVKLESSDPDKFRNIEIQDAIATIRVSFNMQDKRNIDGINHVSGAKILKAIYDELRITGFDRGEFCYEYFMFYEPDSYTVSVYDVNESTNALIVNELY